MSTHEKNPPDLEHLQAGLHEVAGEILEAFSESKEKTSLTNSLDTLATAVRVLYAYLNSSTEGGISQVAAFAGIVTQIRSVFEDAAKGQVMSEEQSQRMSTFISNIIADMNRDPSGLLPD